MKFDKLKHVYENRYKQLMIIPFIILILSISVLGYTKLTTGEFVEKDISLKGGLLITVQTDSPLDANQIQSEIERSLGTSVSVRSLSAIGGTGFAYSFELEKMEIDQVISAIESATGLTLPDGSYTVEEMSSALGETFWKSTTKAILLAILFMSGVVFYYFRQIVPSGAIILAAVSDLIGTLAIINIINVKLSTAGVAALLMLLGYCVDSNILLSVKLLKDKEGSTMDKIYSSIKTGLTMQGTTLAVLGVMVIVSPASVIRQIAGLLFIGLCLEMINTWIQNTGILRWYLEKKSGVKHGQA